MYLERVKILASGLLYLAESSYSETVGAGNRGNDGYGKYTPVSKTDESGVGMRRI